MKKEELLNARDEWLKDWPVFVPNTDPPAFTQTVDEEFSGLKQRGTWDSRPAMLSITDYWMPRVGDLEYENLRRNLAFFTKKVRLPKLLKADYASQLRYLVEEIPEGRPIIDMKLFCGTYSRPQDRESFVKQIEEFALVYEKITTHINHYCPQGTTLSAAQYFHERFRRWRSYSRQYAQNGLASGFTEDEEAKIIGGFFAENDLSRVPMSLFFNIFGNTDIIKTDEGLYYILDVKLEPKPVGFGIAAFIWNMLLYGWQKNVDQMLEDIRMVIDSMTPIEGYLELKRLVSLNLVERLYAAIQIDLRFRRSPYDNFDCRLAVVMMSKLKEVLSRVVRELGDPISL